MGIFNRSVAELFVRLRAARVIGLGLILVGLLRFRPDSNQPVFGLWSYPFFVLLVTVSVLWFAVLFLFGVLFILAQSSAIAPFIYTLF